MNYKIYSRNIIVDFEADDRKIIGSMEIELRGSYGFVSILRANGGSLPMINRELTKLVADKYNIEEFYFIMECSLYEKFKAVTDLKLIYVEDTTVQGKEAYLIKTSTRREIWATKKLKN